MYCTACLGILRTGEEGLSRRILHGSGAHLVPIHAYRGMLHAHHQCLQFPYATLIKTPSCVVSLSQRLNKFNKFLHPQEMKVALILPDIEFRNKLSVVALYNRACFISSTTQHATRPSPMNMNLKARRLSHTPLTIRIHKPERRRQRSGWLQSLVQLQYRHYDLPRHYHC